MLQLVLQETSGPLPTTFFELRDGDIVIGKLQLRHQPSKSDSLPADFESHIYYEIDPAYRDKGYGTKILALGLEKAKELGMQELILTSREDNIPSRRIIEANGGTLIDSSAGHAGSIVRKYRIMLG